LIAANYREELIDDLATFYFEFDPFKVKELTTDQIREYFHVALKKDRIISLRHDKLLGYGEVWRINYEQFGRILCNEPLHIGAEDIETGNIAYVKNVIIHPDFRGDKTVRQFLVSEFFKKNFACDYFVGEARRKKHQPVKVFTRQDAYKKWIHEGKVS